MKFTKQKKLLTYTAIASSVVIVGGVAIATTLLTQPKPVLQVRSVSSISTITSSSFASVSSAASLSASSVPSSVPATIVPVINYKDGAFTTKQTYLIGRSLDTVSITITLQGGVIKSANTFLVSGERQSTNYIGLFNNNFEDQVIGKKLEDIDRVFVSGASLTSGAFTKALADTKNQAKN